MFSTIVEQYGWLVVIVALVVLWTIFKLVRNVIFKVLGIAFALISLFRIWSFFSI